MPESASSADKGKDSDASDTGKTAADDGSGSASKAPSAQPSASATPSPSASASKSTNPLDPLGLGDTLGSLLGGDKDDSSAPASPSPSSSATTKQDSNSGSVVDKAKDTVNDVVKGTGDAAKKAADSVDKTVDKMTKDVKDTASKATGTEKSADGKDAYPCPAHDAQALADAKEEQTPALLPDEPWTLKSSLLNLQGLDYKGIVEVRTYSGKVKKVLKFTAESIDIKDLKQTTLAAGGGTTHVDARAGSTSTIRDGTVTMYTESLKGNLFGLIPITFTPDTPPPLNVPAAFFTNVTVVQVGQFGGTLTVPGMHLYSEGG